MNNVMCCGAGYKANMYHMHSRVLATPICNWQLGGVWVRALELDRVGQWGSGCEQRFIEKYLFAKLMRLFTWSRPIVIVIHLYKG